MVRVFYGLCFLWFVSSMVRVFLLVPMIIDDYLSYVNCFSREVGKTTELIDFSGISSVVFGSFLAYRKG